MIGKDHEFESTRTKIKMIHVLKINQVYYSEIQHLLKIVKSSSNIIQDDYFLMLGRNILDTNMRKNLERLRFMAIGKRDGKSAQNSEYKPIQHNITIREPSAGDMGNDNDEYVEDDDEGEQMEEATDMGDLEQENMANKYETNETSPKRAAISVPLTGLATIVKKPIPKTRSDILPRPPINVRSGPLAAAAARANAIRAATKAISSTDQIGAEEAMDVDAPQPSTSKSISQFNLNAKNSQIRSKQMLLRNILSDNLSNPLFNKGINNNDFFYSIFEYINLTQF